MHGRGRTVQSSSFRPTHRRLATLLALTLVFAGLSASSASASHGRFFNLSYTQTTLTNTAITATVSYRCGFYFSSCPAVGTTVGLDSIIFGDGTSGTPPTYTVISTNPTDDYFVAKGTVNHAYPTAVNGTYTATLSGCCTLSSIQGGNNDSNYGTSMKVSPYLDSESPTISMPPITTVGNSGVQHFSVPANDTGGQTLHWRLATNAEAGGANVANPAGLTIDGTTGVVSWDTTGKPLGLYSGSVVVEAVNALGTVVSNTEASYLINVANVATNHQPDWVSPPTPADQAQFNVNPGSTLTIDVTAADADTADTVKVGNVGLPTGATFTTVDGNPATGHFSWTPTAVQNGDYLLTVTSQDNHGLSGPSRTFKIHVNNPAADLKIVKTATASSVSAGSSLGYTLTLTNQGPFAATSVVVTDNLPAAYANAATTTTGCSIAAQKLTCNYATIANAGTKTITITGNPTSAAAPTLSNTASVAASESDPDTTNNSSKVDVTVTNDPPTAALAGANPTSPDEGPAQRTFNYAITTRAGSTITSVTTSCGAHGSKVVGSDTYSNTAGSFACVFPDGPNTSTVSAAVTNSDGDTSSASTQVVTVNNVAPTATFTGGAPSADEGSTQHFTYTATDPGDDTITVVTSCGDHATKVAGSDTATGFDCVMGNGPDSTTVSATPTDSDGAGGTPATRGVNIVNAAPSASLNGPVSADEGSTRTYTYTTSDPGNDAVSVAPSCGANGTLVAGSKTASQFKCTFGNGPGTSTVSATPTDSDGDDGTPATKSVTIGNVAPGATVTGSGSSDEGATHNYSYTTSDPGGDSVSVAVSCGDHGTLVAGSDDGSSFQCTFGDGPDTSTVSVTPTDADGADGTPATQDVTINNVAPSATVDGPATTDEGSTETYSYTTSDPGGDTVSVALSCGDHGTLVPSSDTGSDFQCKFGNGPDTSTVSVTPTDADGADGTPATKDVTIGNAAPSATVDGPSSADEGSTETYSYTTSDPGGDTVSVALSCGDHGTFVPSSDTGSEFQCTFANGPDTSTVSVTPTDADGADGTAATKDVTIDNVAPSATVDGPATTDEGSTETYSYTTSDAGGDNVSVALSCGDHGTLVTGSDTGSEFQCKFGNGPDTSTVSVTPTDADGADGTPATKDVTIGNAAPSATVTGSDSADEGSTHNYSYSTSDPGGDTVSVVLSCGADGTVVTGSDTGSAFQCTFGNGPATSTVSVTPTDSDGAEGAAATEDVTIDNVAPSATVDGPSSANEGTTHTYTYTTSDPGGDAVTVTTSCGDNGTKVAGSETDSSFDCTFPDGPADSTVSVTPSDGGGASRAASARKRFTAQTGSTGAPATEDVSISNVAPSAGITGPATADEGSTHTYNYTTSDPGDDTVTVVPSCGSHGTVVADSDTGSAFQCKFGNGPDTSAVSVTPTDSDGAQGSAATQSVSIGNVAPSATVDGPGSAGEGSTQHYTFTTSDPGGDTVTVVTSCGDHATKVAGSETATGFDCLLGDGPAATTVSVTPTDSDSAAGSAATKAVDIVDVAPSASVSGPATVDEATTHHYSFTTSDPGDDTVTVSTSCGDHATKVAGSQTATGFDCAFPDGPADTTVSATATDSDGAAGAPGTQAVHVADVAPTATISGPASAAPHSTQHYSFTTADVGDDTVTVVTSCGAHGTKVAGSDTATGFDCVFGDGPSTTNASVIPTDSDGTPGPTAIQTVAIGAAGAPPKPNGAHGSSPSSNLGLPTGANACASKRRFTIHLKHPHGDQLRWARVYVDGKSIPVIKARVHHWRAVIDLRGQPRHVAVIRIIAVTRSGRHVHQTRTYHPCLAGHYHPGGAT